MVRFHSEVILTGFNFSLLKENIYFFIISCKVKVLPFTEINDLLSMQFFFPKPEENHLQWKLVMAVTEEGNKMFPFYYLSY